MVRLGEVVPGFSADSSTGQLDWHAYIDNSWAVLFSHPVRAQGRGQGGVGVRALECELITGPRKGDVIFVPRVPARLDDEFWPWPWYRRQFPVRVAYAMTINKAQGQTLERCGLQLLTPCFSHGQLYVGMSRVGHPDNLQIMIPEDAIEDDVLGAENITANVVYEEVLDVRR